MLGLGILDLLDVSGRILAGDDASLADHIPDRPTRLLIPRPRVSGFGKSSEKSRMPAPGRDCVKRLFARRVGWLTGEFDAKSRLKLHLRG